MGRKKKRRIALAVAAAVVIGGIIAYNYHIDQVRIRGGVFGDQIKSIQDDLKTLQTEFAISAGDLREGKMAMPEFQEAAGVHLAEMEGILERYGSLDPPGPFAPSVELFRLSTQSQLERDRQIILWLETGDESYNIRADELHRESFTHELAALADFRAAQTGGGP